jgi:hypothetical protein
MMKNLIDFLRVTFVLALLCGTVHAQNPEPAQTKASQATQQLQDKVDHHYRDALREYLDLAESDHGKILNSDIAIQLSPDYRSDSTLVAAVRAPAQSFIKRLYAEKLAGPPQPGFGVLFSAGGTGAGKTTSLNMLAPIVEQTEIVYDTTMSDLPRAIELIDQALTSGRNVTVMYVYRDPVEAFVNGVLPRAMETGRTVGIAYHVSSHVGARRVMDALSARYAGDARFNLISVDNTRGRGKQTIVALNTIPAVDARVLTQTLRVELDQARKNGRISEAVYLISK